jgi:SagB-type dehydrogenase family enzyme
MKRRKRRSFLLILYICLVCVSGQPLFAKEKGIAPSSHFVSLPKPRLDGHLSLEEAINIRRSIKTYQTGALNLFHIAQLLWASCGVTIDGVTGATRAYPSPGARYALEVYVIAGDVKNLSPGVYRYQHSTHSLILIKRGDIRKSLSNAAFLERCILQAPVSFVLTAVYKRATQRYGERGRRYVDIAVGHASQNVLLQAQSLGLGCVPIGAFWDDMLVKVLDLKEEKPLLIIPIGRK